MDAFISHSSEDAGIAEKVQKILGDAGLTLWLDRSTLRYGVLLRDELLAALRGSRVTILLWSKAASKSRWVASEFLSAYHMDHFIIPVRLDKTRLPQFLQNTVYLDVGRSGEQVLESLPRAVREAPDGANRFSPIMASPTHEQNQTGYNIAAIQQKELALIPGELAEARKVHAEADVMVRQAEKQWKYNSMILALSGYHRKNAYLLKHWEAIEAGRPPQDALLLRAEARFFETLFVNPEDPSGLNGLGSTLMLERELYAAEFFILRAIEFAKRAGGAYPEAEHDLALVRRYLTERPPAAGSKS
jgi:Flp pilus assembly protein TadD